MKNMLAQLESNEAVLLMYLADELHEQDRAEVEHLLQRDGGMRAELERLRSAMASMDTHFAQADARMQVNAQAVTRSTIRAMQQWRARGAVRKTPAGPPEASLPLPWWCYPMAAAASILLALAVWLSNTEPSMIAGGPPIRFPTPIDSLRPAIWEDSSPAILPPVEEARAYIHAGELAASFDNTDQLLSECLTDNLSDAQHQLRQLQQVSQDMQN